MLVYEVGTGADELLILGGKGRQFLVERSTGDALLHVVYLYCDVATLKHYRQGWRAVEEDVGNLGGVNGSGEAELSVYDIAGVDIPERRIGKDL